MAAPVSIWTFSNNPPPNKNGGDKLNGCHIVDQGGGVFQFTEPDPNKVLKTISSTGFPLKFKNFSHKSDTWDVTVNSLGVFGGSGRWETPAKAGITVATTPQDGDFTAQAGTGVDPEPGDEVAAAARAKA